MILDLLSNAAIYERLHPGLAPAFQFLRRPDIPDMAEGRHAIDNDRIYAIVQEYDTKPMSEGFLEIHNRYLDVQFLVSGEEWIGYAPLAGQLIQTPYDHAKDAALLKGPSEPVHVRAGQFAIFFPHDAHQPCRTLGASVHVRKVVVKVAVSG
jgi:YhcH/YjgK/YiaL family protein